MKTIGTLEEIGAQVGDVVEYYGCGIPGGHRTVASDKPNAQGYWTATDTYDMGQDSPHWRIITKAAKSPVRTVTRKEIVPGMYGRVNVADTAGQWIEIEFICEYGHTGRPRLTASDLTAAIKTLTEIRDAMAGDE